MTSTTCSPLDSPLILPPQQFEMCSLCIWNVSSFLCTCNIVWRRRAWRCKNVHQNDLGSGLSCKPPGSGERIDLSPQSFPTDFERRGPLRIFLAIGDGSEDGRPLGTNNGRSSISLTDGLSDCCNISNPHDALDGTPTARLMEITWNTRLEDQVQWSHKARCKFALIKIEFDP